MLFHWNLFSLLKTVVVCHHNIKITMIELLRYYGLGPWALNIWTMETFCHPEGTERDLGNKRSEIKSLEPLVPGITESAPKFLLEPKDLREWKETWETKGLDPKVRKNFVRNQKFMEVLGTGIKWNGMRYPEALGMEIWWNGMRCHRTTFMEIINVFWKWVKFWYTAHVLTDISCHFIRLLCQVLPWPFDFQQSSSGLLVPGTFSFP